MSISLKINGKKDVPLNIFKFPSGETGVRIDCSGVGTIRQVVFKLSWESNDDIINLCLAVDAFRREFQFTNIFLKILYFPYARQDRVMSKGESLSVKVIADIINSLGFLSVTVLDPHSDVLPALLKNCDIYPGNIGLENTIEDGYSHIVSPDAGALKKINKLAVYLTSQGQEIQVVRADKTRCVKTGKITDTVVYSPHLGNANLLVVDDILDGGGTFIPLAKELRKITTGRVSLFVSHGIFTDGVDKFKDLYDTIYVVNNMLNGKFPDTHNLIKEVN